MPNSPPSHCSPDTYRYSLVFRWAADTAEMWKPLVAFRYRMLRTTWLERAFHCHTPEYHCLPTSSWGVHRAATKKSKFSELFCYIFKGAVKVRQIWMELETSKNLDERNESWEAHVSFPLPKGSWGWGYRCWFCAHQDALEGSESRSSF